MIAMCKTRGIRAGILFLSVFIATWAAGCAAEEPDPATNVEAYIDAVIDAHGGDVLDRAIVTFTFRGAEFTLEREDGRFHYRRAYADSLDQRVVEGITNEDVYRVVEADTVAIDADTRGSIETTVNSVAYFALLPYPLQDPPVQATYAGPDTVGETRYHRVAVTFGQGGGADYQDEFLYWFDANTHAMDYMAYAFGVGGPEEDQGTRFREAYNVRRMEGVRFADYRNYVSESIEPGTLSRYPAHWRDDAVELVSTVELENVAVQPLP